MQCQGVNNEESPRTPISQNRSRQDKNSPLYGVEVIVGSCSLLELRLSVAAPCDVSVTYPAAEGFKWIHRLFVSCLVFADIIEAPIGRWQWIEL